MHIKEICLEGFKSYATRTVVSGFDPFFNAITGLNGSGKSNILDSICFVLGITNLQQVRASNLQELVYKQGQAGITKATVSIVFDNSDRSRSPLGYEDSLEITVTRQVRWGLSCILSMVSAILQTVKFGRLKQASCLSIFCKILCWHSGCVGKKNKILMVASAFFMA